MIFLDFGHRVSGKTSRLIEQFNKSPHDTLLVVDRQMKSRLHNIPLRNMHSYNEYQFAINSIYTNYLFDEWFMNTSFGWDTIENLDYQGKNIYISGTPERYKIDYRLKELMKKEYPEYLI